MEPQGPSIVKDQRQRVPLGFLTRLRMGLKQTGLLLVRLQKIYLYLIKQARFLFTMLCDIIQRCYLSFNCPVASKIMVLSTFHGIIFFCFWVHSKAGYWVWNRLPQAVSVLIEHLWASVICEYLSGEARSSELCSCQIQSNPALQTPT